jgi:hypothetical protein
MAEAVLTVPAAEALATIHRRLVRRDPGPKIDQVVIPTSGIPSQVIRSGQPVSIAPITPTGITAIGTIIGAVLGTAGR